MTKLYTIGFAEKSAREFFDLLKNSGGSCLFDIRLNNVSQLAGFTKKEDLKFFLEEILHWQYRHCVDLAPTKDILDDYKGKIITWKEYEDKFLELLRKRTVEEKYSENDLNGAVFLCSEHRYEKCHRRLTAEHFKRVYTNIEIVHLY